MGKLTRISFVVLTVAFGFSSINAYLTTTSKSVQSPTREEKVPYCKKLDFSCLAKEEDFQKFEKAINASSITIENLERDATVESKEILLKKFVEAQGSFEKRLHNTPEFGCAKTNECLDTLTKIFQEAIDELRRPDEDEDETKIATFAKSWWKKWRRKIGKFLRVAGRILFEIGRALLRERSGRRFYDGILEDHAFVKSQK